MPPQEGYDGQSRGARLRRNLSSHVSAANVSSLKLVLHCLQERLQCAEADVGDLRQQLHDVCLAKVSCRTCSLSSFLKRNHIYDYCAIV